MSTTDYVNPFFNRMDLLQSEYIIEVKKADQLSGTESNPDLIFNKVHIKAILPESYYYENEYIKCLGFTYELDTRIPIAKFYIADIDKDGNIFSFDVDNIVTQEIEDVTPINYNPIQTLLEKTDNNSIMIRQMKNTKYAEHEKIVDKLGQWVDYALNRVYIQNNGKIKLSTTTSIDVYKSLKLNKDSKYYVDVNKDIMIENVYKVFAELVKKDKDIVNNFEKTILFTRMLGL